LEKFITEHVNSIQNSFFQIELLNNGFISFDTLFHSNNNFIINSSLNDSFKENNYYFEICLICENSKGF
jgi:hypothetical protein